MAHKIGIYLNNINSFRCFPLSLKPDCETVTWRYSNEIHFRFFGRLMSGITKSSSSIFWARIERTLPTWQRHFIVLKRILHCRSMHSMHEKLRNPIWSPLVQISEYIGADQWRQTFPPTQCWRRPSWKFWNQIVPQAVRNNSKLTSGLEELNNGSLIGTIRSIKRLNLCLSFSYEMA